jgi:uncharacterized membrane protein YraQ (UPF0718 family)
MESNYVVETVFLGLILALILAVAVGAAVHYFVNNAAYNEVHALNETIEERNQEVNALKLRLQSVRSGGALICHAWSIRWTEDWRFKNDQTDEFEDVVTFLMAIDMHLQLGHTVLETRAHGLVLSN